MYNKNGKIGLFKADNGGLFHRFRINSCFCWQQSGSSGPSVHKRQRRMHENHHAQRTEPPHQGGPHTDRTPKRLHLRLLRQHLGHPPPGHPESNESTHFGNVLKVLFAGTDNTWKLSGRQIVIGRSVAAAAATPRKITRITGVVRDQNNDPLIGVTIRIKARPNIGTATDINGKYLLDVYPDEVLEFSYVGYKSQDVSVAGQEIVDVVMLQNDAILDAVEGWWATACRKRSASSARSRAYRSRNSVPVANLTRPCGPRIEVWSRYSEPANRASTTRTSTSAASQR